MKLQHGLTASYEKGFLGVSDPSRPMEENSVLLHQSVNIHKNWSRVPYRPFPRDSSFLGHLSTVFVSLFCYSHRIPMYAIYGNIYHQYTPNVSIYIYIHIPYMYPMGLGHSCFMYWVNITGCKNWLCPNDIYKNSQVANGGNHWSFPLRVETHLNTSSWRWDRESPPWIWLLFEYTYLIGIP